MTADTRRELVAGLTTFFTMAYIVVVNPSILSTAGTGMPFSGALTATVLLCFTMTLLMGLYAKAAVRRRARHGPQRVLRVLDRPGPARAVADGAGHRVLGGRALPGDLAHATAGPVRPGDPGQPAHGGGGGDRPLPHVHRLEERRHGG